MKKKDIEYFRKVLTNQLEELLNRVGNTVLDIATPIENLPDLIDLASFESDRDFMLHIRDRESKLIKKIKMALDRIEDGTFGVCETCGEDISIARLKARSVTTQCIDCKTREETVERALGF
jgi:DnaK suppressor protein